jgi:rhodanese-related sulfurtransferase
MSALSTSSVNPASSGHPRRTDLLRAFGIVIAAATLGLLLNVFSRHPLPLMAADGPGALPERWTRIGIEQYKQAEAERKSLLIVDVREPATFAAGHPASSLNAPARNFIDHYVSLAPYITGSDIVVLLCDSDECPSADRVAKLLHDAGHENIRVLYDGWKAWSASGLPTEIGAADLPSPTGPTGAAGQSGEAAP